MRSRNHYGSILTSREMNSLIKRQRSDVKALKVDRLVPKRMTAGPGQHVGDNAFHPFRFNALTLHRFNPKTHGERGWQRA